MTIVRTGSENKKNSTPPEITAADLPEYRPPSLRDRILGGVLLFAVIVLLIRLIILVCKPLFIMALNPEAFESFIRQQGAAGWMKFLGIQVLQGFLPIPLELTTIAGGYAFGKVQGCLITIFSVMISTTMIFYFTKVLGHRLIGLFFTPAQRKRMDFILSTKMRGAFYWVVFLIPGMPKRIFVFSAGLVPQNFGRFLLISTLARVPSLLACSFGGWALENGNYSQAAVLFLVIGVLSACGLFLYRSLRT